MAPPAAAAAVVESDANDIASKHMGELSGEGPGIEELIRIWTEEHEAQLQEHQAEVAALLEGHLQDRHEHHKQSVAELLEGHLQNRLGPDIRSKCAPGWGRNSTPNAASPSVVKSELALHSADESGGPRFEVDYPAAHAPPPKALSREKSTVNENVLDAIGKQHDPSVFLKQPSQQAILHQQDAIRHTNHPWDILPTNSITKIGHQVHMFVLDIEEPERSGCVHSLIYTKAFETLCTTVIMLNSVFAGFRADYELANPGEDLTPFIHTVEWVLLVFYTLEVLMKLWVHRLHFFVNGAWRWNTFDLSLVVMSGYDQLSSLVHPETRGSSVTFMRMFRIIKLSKVMRVFRVVKVLRELRTMLLALAGSMMSLFWAVLMLIFVLYVFGLIFMQGFSDMLADSVTVHGHEIPEKDRDELLFSFGSMVVAMTTLYMSGTGGDDWSFYYRMVQKAGDGYGTMFLFYIAFFTFAVMNILTGMIVDNIMTIGSDDEDVVAMAFRRKNFSAVDAARRLFASMDLDHSGKVSKAEFDDAIRTAEVMALLEVVELDARDAELFFDMLLAACEPSCADGVEPAVDIDMFVDGCMKMKGSATSIELQCLAFSMKLMQETCRGLKVDLSELKAFTASASTSRAVATPRAGSHRERHRHHRPSKHLQLADGACVCEEPPGPVATKLGNTALLFVFGAQVGKLGLEIVWHKGLPFAGKTDPLGAAHVHGVAPGDEFTECNGLVVAGRPREEVLESLKVRPLHLKVRRYGS